VAACNAVTTWAVGIASACLITTREPGPGAALRLRVAPVMTTLPDTKISSTTLGAFMR
jgi:hypothetical protein